MGIRITITGETLAEVHEQFERAFGGGAAHEHHAESGALEPDCDGERSVAVPPEVDSQGLPWDERIHTSTRAVNVDGTWRRRRNLDDAVYDSVMAELQGAPAQAEQPAPPPPAEQPAPPPPPVPAEQPAPPPPPAQAEQPAPPPPPPAQAEQPAAPRTFAELIVRCNQDGIGMDLREQGARAVGAQSFAALSKPEFAPVIPNAWETMTALTEGN